MATPVRNQRLYKVWNGELETVLFREQSIADGAFAETWLVFNPKDSKRIRCSIGSYYTTQYDAWRAELKSWQDGVKASRNAVTVAKQNLKQARETVAKLKVKVAETKTA